MTERKSVLLRLDPAVHDALARWASDELRSTNAQIEFLLRRALADARREPAQLTVAPPGCGQEHLRSGDGRLARAAAGEREHVAACIDLQPGGSLRRVCPVLPGRPRAAVTLDKIYQSDIILLGGRIADTTADGKFPMNAQNDNTASRPTTTWWRWGTPPRSGMQRLIAPWEYRHLRAWAGARTAIGIVLAGLGAVTLIGGSFSPKAAGFATLFLAAAAAQLLFAAWERAIARSASART